MSSSPISFNKSNKEKLEKNQRFHLQDRSCKHKKIESFPNITHPNLIVCLSESYYYYCSSVTLRGPPRVTQPERPKGAKDHVMRPKGPPTRSRGPEGPLDF